MHHHHPSEPLHPPLGMLAHPLVLQRTSNCSQHTTAMYTLAYTRSCQAETTLTEAASNVSTKPWYKSSLWSATSIRTTKSSKNPMASWLIATPLAQSTALPLTLFVAQTATLIRALTATRSLIATSPVSANNAHTNLCEKIMQ